MINCYEILNIPNFSSKQEIRKAYLVLAKKHHPDVAKGSDGEQFKIISKAYDLLQDPLTKNFHDKKLKAKLSGAVEPAPRTGRGQTRYASKEAFIQDLIKRKARYERLKLRRDIEGYRVQNKALSYGNRLIGYLVLCMYGWYLIFERWYWLEDSTDQMVIFLGVMLYIVSATLFYSTLYKKNRLAHYDATPNKPFKDRGRRYWVLVLAVGVVTLLAATSYQKRYHLKHYATYAQVQFLYRPYSDKALISFSPPGYDQRISKTITLTDDVIVNERQGWLLIRYSARNPRIVEPVRRGDYLPAPLK